MSYSNAKRGNAARRQSIRQAPQLFELLACNVNFLWEGAREGYLFSKKRYPSLIRVPHTRWKKPELIVPKGTVRYFLLQQKPF